MLLGDWQGLGPVSALLALLVLPVLPILPGRDAASVYSEPAAAGDTAQLVLPLRDFPARDGGWCRSYRIVLDNERVVHRAICREADGRWRAIPPSPQLAVLPGS